MTAQVKSQAGGAGSKMIVSLLLIIISGLAGWLGWKYHFDDKIIKQNQQLISQQSQKTVTANDTSAAHSLDDGKQFVSDTYQQYIQTVPQHQAGGQQNLDLIKAKLTPDLYAALSARYAGGANADYIICSQAVPSSYDVEPSGQADSSGEYTVAESFGPGKPVEVKVAVQLSSLLISGITCP